MTTTDAIGVTTTLGTHVRIWPPRVWPVVRHASAPRRVVVGAGLAGALGAVALGDPGLGYPVTVAAVLVVVAIARPHRRSAWYVAGAGAVLALGSIAFFRSAEWLVTVSMWSAVFVTAAVLSGSRTWRGLLLGAVAPAFVPVRTVRWTVNGIRQLDTGRVRPGRIVLVGVTTMILVLVFTALFGGADPRFGSVVAAATPEWDLGSLVGRVVLFFLVGGGALAASYLSVVRPRFDRLARSSRSTVRLWEWAFPVGGVVAVFGAFVAVQATTLFGGQEHVLVTDGLTNAEYARQGFWQLLWVTALTLLVIAIVVDKAPRTSPRERGALRILLGLLCMLALVVVVSALHRMSLYEEQYGYTTLRLFVSAVESMLGGVFVLIMIAGVTMSGRWLPRAVGVAVVSTVLGLAVLNPDAYVARHNVERFETSGKIDTRYLSQLSADATPELDRLPEPFRSCALSEPDSTTSWREWNVADARASRILEERPVRICTR